MIVLRALDAVTMKTWRATITAAIVALLLEGCDPVHRITKSATLQALPDVNCVESALRSMGPGTTVERVPPIVPSDTSTTFNINGVRGFGITIAPTDSGWAEFKIDWVSVMSPSRDELADLRTLMASAYAVIRSHCEGFPAELTSSCQHAGCG